MIQLPHQELTNGVSPATTAARTALVLSARFTCQSPERKHSFIPAESIQPECLAAASNGIGKQVKKDFKLKELYVIGREIRMVAKEKRPRKKAA